MTREGPDDSDVFPAEGGKTAEAVVHRIVAENRSAEAAVEQLDERLARDDDSIDDIIDDLTGVIIDDVANVTVADRLSAISVLAFLVSDRPRYASRGVSVLAGALDDPVVETTALRGLARITDETPTAVDPVLDSVGERLTGNPIPARMHSVTILERRADDDPEAIAGLSPRLVDAVVSTEGMRVVEDELPDHHRSRLEEQSITEERLRQKIATILADLAEADSGAVASEVDRLTVVVEPSRARNPYLKDQIVEIVCTVAGDSPEAVVGSIDTLYDVVESTDTLTPIRANAAKTLATLADTHFDAATASARSAIPALGELLGADDPRVRANAGGFLSYVSQRYPDETASLTGTLIARLDDEEVPIRASVIWALGYVDTEATREALRKTADEDPDPDVRALATRLLSSESGA